MNCNLVGVSEFLASPFAFILLVISIVIVLTLVTVVIVMYIWGRYNHLVMPIVVG